MEIFLIILINLIINIIWGCITEAIANTKNIQQNGFWYGFFLRIIGVIWVLCLKPAKPNYTNIVYSKSIPNTIKEKILELKKLHNLKTNGFISLSEFNRKKSEILNDILCCKKIVFIDQKNCINNYFDIYINGNLVFNDIVKNKEIFIFDTESSNNTISVSNSDISFLGINLYIDVNIDKFETIYLGIKNSLINPTLKILHTKKEDSNLFEYELIEQLNNLKKNKIILEEEYDILKSKLFFY